MSTIADRMDVMADSMEDIGQVDWASTLRGLAAEVRDLIAAMRYLNWKVVPPDDEPTMRELGYQFGPPTDTPDHS